MRLQQLSSMANRLTVERCNYQPSQTTNHRPLSSTLIRVDRCLEIYLPFNQVGGLIIKWFEAIILIPMGFTTYTIMSNIIINHFTLV